VTLRQPLGDYIITVARGRLDHVSGSTCIGSFDPFLFVIIGLTVMLIGLILFGTANLRQPVLGQWQ
jgi:hypothetical protein